MVEGTNIFDLMLYIVDFCKNTVWTTTVIMGHSFDITLWWIIITPVIISFAIFIIRLLFWLTE